MVRIGKCLDCPVSGRSMLKIVEIINLLIATGMVGAFLDKVPEGFFAVAGKKGFLQLFMAVVVIGWILVLVLFFVFLIGLHERFSSIKWSLGVAIVFAVWAVLLLISSVLVADALAHYYEKKITVSSRETFFSGSICDWLHQRKVNLQCRVLIGGAICGFIAMVLFAFDAFIHFFVYFKLADGSTATVPAVPT